MATIKAAFQKTQYIKNDFKQLSQDDVILYQEDVFQKDLHDQQIEKDCIYERYNLLYLNSIQHSSTLHPLGFS